MGGRQLMRWELDGVDGPVVVIDVLRAFTTAAYAFGAGASAIYLVATVEEALMLKADHPDVLAMGEDHGRRPDGFDFPNSPVAVSRADLAGRTIVQRTSAGTQGVVAAVDATRLWAASLVCASATARAVEASTAANQLLDTMEASRTLALGPAHCDPLDIEFASDVDRFDFAMEVTTDDIGRRLEIR